MAHMVYSSIVKAVRSGQLTEPFTKDDFRNACPGLAMGTYAAFLDKHRKGNPGHNSELFERQTPGRFTCIRPFRYGLVIKMEQGEEGDREERLPMFEGLVSQLDPPANRRGKCDGEKELHLTEAAVMLAYGMHLLATVPQLNSVELHPDGEHGKRFEIAKCYPSEDSNSPNRKVERAIAESTCMETRAFWLHRLPVRATWSRTLRKDQSRRNVRAASSIRAIPDRFHVCVKGFREAIGLLMARDLGGQQIAVVPYTPITLRLAQKMVPRVTAAGIQIALVDEFGHVIDIRTDSEH